MHCVTCGSTNLVQGKVSWTVTEADKFFPSGAGLLGQILGTSSRAVRAHACTHCGHLQLIVEFTEEDRTRYQTFEGPPRSVTDE